MALLDGLNDRQKLAAEQTEGPIMIIAGAGSGKTRTLMYRVANLIDMGVDPYRILVLTFTNKAADEMKERIAKLVGPKAMSLWMGTFHSVFYRILRQNATCLGFSSDFTIADTDDTKSLINKIIKEKELDPNIYKTKAILGRISAAKNALISSQDYAGSLGKPYRDEDSRAQKPLLYKIYEEYQNRLYKSNAMDFDDLLFYTNLLFRDFPDVLRRYQEQFAYIMVDEYQDTNYAQYIIIRRLGLLRKNICVVGDDSQSIYGFRGADISHILNFQRDYPETKLIKLEQNYRSSSNIVKLSNEVISNNEGRIPKEVWTENQNGEQVELIVAQNGEEEAKEVAQRIIEIGQNSRLRPKDFAVLYRTNSQSRNIEDALRRFNIPYKIYGGQSFYKRKEVKDVVAYLKWVVNPRDEASFSRCINLPKRGIGDETIDKLRIFASSQSLSLMEAINELRRPQMQLISNINMPTILKLIRVYDLIMAQHTRVDSTDAYTLARDIWQMSELKGEYLKEGVIEAEAKIENVEELLNSIKDYVDREHFDIDEQTGEMYEYTGLVGLGRFMQEISLLTDMDAEAKTEEEKDVVKLMTIHASKGLEFPHVFLIGCEDKTFPSEMSALDPRELEEERRLFYVACTRAQTGLHLSHSRSIIKFGNRSISAPSMFLLEGLPASVYKNPSLITRERETNVYNDLEWETRERWGLSASYSTVNVSRRKPLTKMDDAIKTRSASASGGSASDDNIREGSRVFHAKFGEGVVLRVEGSGGDKKYQVQFRSVPQPKTLLASFAKLSLL